MRSACTYAALLALAAAGCRDRPVSSSASGSARDTVVVYLAASLTKPLQAALDTFAARNNAVIQRESGGSLEHARKLTELGRIPDVIALADPEVFPQSLMPKYVNWYADFARNRMIIGYTDKSRHAAEIDSVNWPRILAEKDVAVGRPDPNVAPAGYRTVLMLALAEKYYHDPGLLQRILDNAVQVRPNAAELAALLQTGEVDYVFDYESVAAAYGFHALRLPAAIDLGDPARANEYAKVKWRDRTPGDHTVTHSGSPILYALSVPGKAPHPGAGARLAAFLLSAEGRGMMRAAQVDALDHAVFVGTDAPAPIRDAASR